MAGLLQAQIGGSQIFSFVDLSNSARNTALGEDVYARYDDDPTMGYVNPSMLNPSMNQALTFSHNFRFQGVGNGYFSYTRHLPRLDYTAHVGIQYINYGRFAARDETGLPQGEFTAAEQAIVLGAGKQWDERWGFGFNAKYVLSRFEQLSSTGILFDLGLVFRDSSRNLVVSAVLRNVGTQLTTYLPGQRFDTPLEMVVGLSKRMNRLPMTLYLNLSNLQRWQITVDNPFDDPIVFLGQEPEEKGQLATGFDNLMRHVSLGTEWHIGQSGNLKFRLGYNHLRRKELTVQNIRSLAGLSVGFGFKIKKIQIDYGNMVTHVAGSVHHITLSSNLNYFKRVL